MEEDHSPQEHGRTHDSWIPVILLSVILLLVFIILMRISS